MPSLFSPPTHDCSVCPRLAEFRQQNREDYPLFFNAPVPSFGALDARLLVVGLAPGLKGANQTGRPFTGDFAGDVLYPALLRHGLARGIYGRRPDDGFTLHDTRITNAVRCVPQANKPLPQEVKNCGRFLQAKIAAMPDLRAILSLGRVSHGAVLSAFKLKQNVHAFGHGAEHILKHPQTKRPVLLVDSFHTSRYNIQTKRLTEPMFDAIVARLAGFLIQPEACARAAA